MASIAPSIGVFLAVCFALAGIYELDRMTHGRLVDAVCAWLDDLTMRVRTRGGVIVLEHNEIPIIGFDRTPTFAELDAVAAELKCWLTDDEPRPLIISGGGRIIGIRRLPDVGTAEEGDGR